MRLLILENCWLLYMKRSHKFSLVDFINSLLIEFNKWSCTYIWFVTKVNAMAYYSALPDVERFMGELLRFWRCIDWMVFFYFMVLVLSLSVWKVISGLAVAITNCFSNSRSGIFGFTDLTLRNLSLQGPNSRFKAWHPNYLSFLLHWQPSCIRNLGP